MEKSTPNEMSPPKKGKKNPHLTKEKKRKKEKNQMFLNISSLFKVKLLREIENKFQSIRRNVLAAKCSMTNQIIRLLKNQKKKKEL